MPQLRHPQLAQDILADDTADLWLRLDVGWRWLDASLALETPWGESLRDAELFRAVRLDVERQFLGWPNGLTLSVTEGLRDPVVWRRQGLWTRASGKTKRGWYRPLLIGGHPLVFQATPAPSTALHRLLWTAGARPLPPLPALGEAHEALRSQRLLDLIAVLAIQHNESLPDATQRLFWAWPFTGLLARDALETPWDLIAQGRLALVERALLRPVTHRFRHQAERSA